MDIPSKSATPNAKKRSFSMYSADNRLVHWEGSAQNFAIHASLLDQYCNSPRYFLHDCPDKTVPCTSCELLLFVLKDVPDCVYRGFVYWLYHQELPSRDLIKSMEYPEKWNLDAESGPPECVMAIELYFVGLELTIPKLRGTAMALLFRYYKSRGIVPGLYCLGLVFKRCDWMPSEPLRDFCVDLYTKWYSQSPSSSTDHEKFPSKFFIESFKVRAKRNDQVAKGLREDALVFKLCDYHGHQATRGGRKDCHCEHFGERYVIR